MPTPSHILLWDEIKYSSVALYCSDFNLLYYLTLASLPLRFVPFMAQYVTSSKSIPDLEGCCSHAQGDATPSCKRAETAARCDVLSAHTFSLQAAVRVITFNSAWNEIKVQTYTGWMKDEITCLQTKWNLKQQCGGTRAAPSFPALLQPGGRSRSAELKPRGWVPVPGKRGLVPIHLGLQQFRFKTSLPIPKILFLSYPNRLSLFLTKANGIWWFYYYYYLMSMHTVLEPLGILFHKSSFTPMSSFI